MSVDSKTLNERIVKLEAALATARAGIKTAESAIAAAYAAGEDPGPTLGALAEARSNVAGMELALGALEAQWLEIANSEYSAAMAAIDADAQKAYKEVESALSVAVQKAVVPVISRAGISEGLVTTFMDGVLNAGWDLFVARASERKRALGPRPASRKEARA